MRVLTNGCLIYKPRTPKEAETMCIILEKLNKIRPSLHLYLWILPVLFLRRMQSRRTGLKSSKPRGNFNLWQMTVYILWRSGFTTTDELGGRGEVRSADVVKKVRGSPPRA